MALAEATCTYLTDTIQAYTLFSTHYFELTQLKNNHPTIQNVHLDVSFNQDKLVFLYQVKPGASARSYGIEVAALAGVPEVVLALARERLGALGNITAPLPHGRGSDIIADGRGSDFKQAVVQRLTQINPDVLTAREALTLIYELKELLTCPVSTV
jgi:DNA mismatch repair protein MutS